MSIKYKDIIKFGKTNIGRARREDLVKKAILPSDLQLDTLTLEDYDKAFKEWVEKELEITFEDKVIPTVSLFASQRFGEYMQSWKNTDDKKNFLMNFKVLTRENNPKPGTMYGDVKNIPENKYFLINRIETIDENGRPLFLDVKMRQPYCVDITYTVSVVTNKFRMLNDANELINDKFKSITSYLNVKGNYVSTVLDDISDESEYQIDDRQYYSQSYKITVRGYIVRKEDYQVVEEPKIKMACIESGRISKRKSWAEIEDIDPCVVEEKVFKALKITVGFEVCSSDYSFTIDEAMVVNSFELMNVKGFKMFKNGSEVFTYNKIEGEKDIDVRLLPGDRVMINNVLRETSLSGDTKIVLNGYNPYEVIEVIKKKK